jgi:hypothetical protein
MADRKQNLGRARELDFSALEQQEEEADWGSIPTNVHADRTRLAPLEVDDDATRDLPPRRSPTRAPAPAPTRAPPPVPLEPEPEPEVPELRTAFSSRAVLIADLLRDKFSRRFFGRPPYRVLRVDEPEGPSTAGGLLARQAISLVSRQGAAPSVVCGWVDTSKSEAQLRGYESVARRYESHHGTPLDLSPEHYERFLDDMVETLSSGGIKVRVLVLDEQVVAPGQAQVSAPRGTPARARGGGRGMLLLVVGLVLGLLAGRWVPWDRVDEAVGRARSAVSAQVGARP